MKFSDRSKKVGMALFAGAALAVIASAATGAARTGPCVRGIVCTAIYAPVLCPDGNTYSNACEAYRWACQRNCVPAGAI